MRVVSGTETLRGEHRQIRRLERIILRCYTCLEEGRDVPFSDMDRITLVISEFLDSIHYEREENSYFACVASYGGLAEEVRRFMIEHEFGRRVARKISGHLQEWKSGRDSREPVARFLRTYHVYLTDHLAKEDAFFDEAQRNVLAPEEEAEMYEQFRSVMAETRTVEAMIRELDFLEGRPWYTGRL